MLFYMWCIIFLNFSDQKEQKREKTLNVVSFIFGMFSTGTVWGSRSDKGMVKYQRQRVQTRG